MRRLLVLAATVLIVVVPLLPADAAAGARPVEVRGVPAARTAPAVAAADPVVARAQRRLNQLRCDAGPVDGRLGAHTRSAIVRFQSRHRLSQSGALGPTTRRALHSPGARRCDVRPVPRGTGSGRRVVVSQLQNWVWLVGAGGRVVAQGGIVDNPRVLRKGTWSTGSYCGRPARVRLNRSASGSYLLDHFVRFAPCGIGFHRIPRHTSSGRQMHPDFYLGTNLVNDSAGCVRLSRRMAAALWDFTAGRRTTVRVV